MTAKVTEEGLLIPRELLRGFEEVEIRRENDRVIITGAQVGAPKSQGEKMAAALEKIAQSSALSGLKADQWEREIRADRSLSGRTS